MAFKIVTADERLKKQPGIKGVVLGPSGIGKTSLLWTLDPASTLFLDLEAGDLAVEGWSGDSVDCRKAALDAGVPTWVLCQGIACWLGGPNPTAPPSEPYSQAHYDWACSVFGDAAGLDKYATVFVDSITVASRAAFKWSQSQPRAFSEKTGKPDTRGAYGLLGQEMIGWLTQLQHCRGKNVWLVGILDKVTDDFNRTTWAPQIEGNGTKLALPGIVDQVITFAEIDFGADGKHRAFVTQTMNQWSYPAKDRSGQLDPIEEPNLGKLMAKIAGKTRARALTHSIPQASAVAVPEPAAPATAAA